MISQEQFNLLKKSYGDVASWAIWADPDEGRPKSNIGDLSVFNTEDLENLVKKLNSNYVFVALNAAKHEKENQNTWDAFHSTDNRRQQDYKLRHALHGTKFWGSYITDAIKCIVETNAIQVMRYIKQHPEVEADNIEKLQNELFTLQPKVLIAIGNQAYKILSRNFASLKEIVPNIELKKITHYSVRMNKVAYRDKVLSELNKI